MKFTIRRSYLMRHVETWEVTMPDDADPEHLIHEHKEMFDDDLVGGGDPLGGWTSHQTTSEAEPLDYNELSLVVTDRQSANVIPIDRRRR